MLMRHSDMKQTSHLEKNILYKKIYIHTLSWGYENTGEGLSLQGRIIFGQKNSPFFGNHSVSVAILKIYLACINNEPTRKLIICRGRGLIF